MTKDPITVGPETHVRECAELISERGFRHLPVVHDGKPIGVLSVRDFQQYIVSGLETLIDQTRYREALAEGQDPYDHLGGGYSK
jgi:CBS domain-containing protein